MEKDEITRDKKGKFVKGTKSIKGMLGKHQSAESKIKMSIAKKGKNTWMKGKKVSDETKKRMSESKKGEKHHMWKGGVTKDRAKYQRERYKKLSPNDKEKSSWGKNQRNRAIKRLKNKCLSHTFGDWELLKKQYNQTCPSCKRAEPEIKLTEDHIIPLCKGGTDLIENIQPLCLKCNMKKHTSIIKY